MKTISLLFVVFLFIVPKAPAPTPLAGFKGEFDVHSVYATPLKLVIVVSGSAYALFNDPLAKRKEGLHPAASPNVGQGLSTTVDHAVIILLYTPEEFPGDDWQKVCARFKQLSGKQAVFTAPSPQYTLNGSDFTLITTKQLEIEAP